MRIPGRSQKRLKPGKRGINPCLDTFSPVVGIAKTCTDKSLRALQFLRRPQPPPFAMSTHKAATYTIARREFESTLQGGFNLNQYWQIRVSTTSCGPYGQCKKLPLLLHFGSVQRFALHRHLGLDEGTVSSEHMAQAKRVRPCRTCSQ